MILIKRLILLLLLTAAGHVYSQTSSVTGFIQNERGDGIPFSKINVLNSPVKISADFSGIYSFDIIAGFYFISVSADGYASVIKSFTVTSDQSINLNFILKENTIELNEMITAYNKREQKFIQTPVSVTILEDQKINKDKIWELKDLKGIVPNFQYNDYNVRYRQILNIRGITTTNYLPAVSTFIDGVKSYTTTANGIQLFDIERIEITRGPQSALFGKNAMGGVINIITKQPDGSTSGFGEVSLGELGLQKYGLAYRSSLFDGNLYFGLSGQYQKQNGYYHNDLSGTSLAGSSIDGRRIGDEKSWYGNIYFKYLAGRSTELILNSKGENDESQDATAYFISPPDPQQSLSNPYKYTLGTLGSSERALLNTSLTVNHYNKNFTLSSVTSAQFATWGYDSIDVFANPDTNHYMSSYVTNPGDLLQQEVISQEFNLISPDKNKNIKWTAGIFGFYQTYEDGSVTQNNPSGFLSSSNIYKTDYENFGAALYGQLLYMFSKKFSITGGLRYDYENRKVNAENFILREDTTIYNSFPNEVKNNFNVFTPKIIMSYNTNDKTNFYLSYNRGFNEGGILPTSNIESHRTLVNVFSDNFEVGGKSEFMDDKFFLGMSAFYTSWDTGLQLFLGSPRSMKSIGAELEFSCVPIRNFNVDYSFGFVNSEDKDFSYKSIFTPAVTSFLMLQYSIPVSIFSSSSWIRFSGDWSFYGKQYFDFDNITFQDPYSVFAAQAGISSLYLDLTIWCDNLSDLNYLQNSVAIPGLGVTLGQPRNFGITLTGKF